MALINKTKGFTLQSHVGNIRFAHAEKALALRHLGNLNFLQLPATTCLNMLRLWEYKQKRKNMKK